MRLPLLAAIAKGDFGSTADPALNTQTVNFLTNLDTTGGNSGSPVLNAKGELIGLNFDSNWESVSASWWFDPRYKRAVHVDMRYLRWLLAKVYPAPELLKEMGVPAQLPATTHGRGPHHVGPTLVGVVATRRTPATPGLHCGFFRRKRARGLQLILLLVSVAYAALLFGVAWWGDRRPMYPDRPWLRPVVYSPALAVYCSSWTFYGAVGTAVRNGVGYLPIYIGPLLLLLFGWRIIERLALIARSQNVVSIADFISSRFGRSRRLAALVAIIALIGIIPYLALQYKAVAMSLQVLTGNTGPTGFFTDPALYVALLMALFATLFGTRQVDATEHHHGMMLAIAFESVIAAGDAGRGRVRLPVAEQPHGRGGAVSAYAVHRPAAGGLHLADPAQFPGHHLPVTPVPRGRGRVR